MAYTTINKSTDYFNTKLYTGNAGTQTITGVDFQPDWTWIKNRSAAEHHVLTDAVRGVDKQLNTNRNNAELSLTTQLTAFTSDGFSVGAGAEVNGNGNNMVSWNWKANGAGSANGDGDINSTVSVNTTSGFSIVTYTGTGATATVGHGLGVAPKVVLIKGVSNSGSWGMYHSSLGADKKILLNTTAAETSSGWMNSTAPTSSVFTVINDADVGTSGYTYVAYCFAEKNGFSKFGSYEGNGSTNGTFVYTGFKPAFVMIKVTSGIDNWFIFDNKRSTSGGNVVDDYLYPNSSNAEGGSDILDFTSNGFKLRTTDGGQNGSSGSYIYLAFAAAPIVGTNDIPANAR